MLLSSPLCMNGVLKNTVIEYWSLNKLDRRSDCFLLLLLLLLMRWHWRGDTNFSLLDQIKERASENELVMLAGDGNLVLRKKKLQFSICYS